MTDSTDHQLHTMVHALARMLNDTKMDAAARILEDIYGAEAHKLHEVEVDFD